MDYHEYGVNVKVYRSLYIKGQEVIPEDELYSIGDYCTEMFWESLDLATEAIWGKNVYSEGRMGGWAIFDTGEYEPPDAWRQLVIEKYNYIVDEVYPQMVQDSINDVDIPLVQS